MAKANGETWGCPTCDKKRFPYGEPCPTWATGCENMRTPNINGAIYLRKRADWQPLDMSELAATSNGELLDTSQQLAIGIAAISDEDTKNDKHD
jgi:hypothetical protein